MKERKLPRITLKCFETGRRSQTQPSMQVFRLTQQMDVWLLLKKEPLPRGTIGELKT